MKHRIALLLAATAAAGALAWPDGVSDVSASPDPAPQTAAPAAEGARLVSGLGIVEPAAGEIDLAFPMIGVIEAVHVQEGEAVTRGAVLAELSNEDLKARLAQAKATLSIRTAEFDRLFKGARPQEIARAESDLASEEASLQLLKLQAERRQKLARKGSVAQEAADAATSALQAGQQRRDAAAEALSMLREGERPETIAAAAAAMELARHQMEEAEATLGKSYLKAPAAGTVLRLFREAGEAVSTQPAVPIVQLGDLSRLVVRAQIDESDIASLRVGQTAFVTAPALQGRRIPGKVTRISPRLGAKTVSDGSPTEKRDARVLDVILSLDPEAKLPVSLRVDAFIDLGSLPTAADQPGPIQIAGWTLRE